MPKDQELNHIRSALAALPRRYGRRFSPELSRSISRYVRRRAREGMSRAALARELGVSEPAVGRALAREPEALVPIRIVAEASPPPPRRLGTVRAPGGLVIEGLDVESIVTLIRALS